MPGKSCFNRRQPQQTADHCPCSLVVVSLLPQKLKPEYAKAATELKKYDDKIVIGKVS